MKRTLADVLVESKDASAIVGERGDVRRLSSRSRAHVQDQITWSVVAHSVKNSNQSSQHSTTFQQTYRRAR
jgi:hypothetical protein